MKARILVTFDMEFAADACKTDVRFQLKDAPHVKCDDALRAMVLDQIAVLARAASAASEHFEKGGAS